MKSPNASVKQIEIDLKVSDTLEVDIDEYEKATKVPLRMAVDDIVENTLKRAASRKRILQDYPLSKLKVEKPPKVVSLPNALKSMLKESDIDSIEKYWNENYANKRYSEWGDGVSYYPEMKP
jgi:hypothetical protein